MHAALTALVTACALMVAPVHAAPARGKPAARATDPAVLAAFEAGFKEGQALLDAGDPLAAARRWVQAADLLPESTVYRDQRAGIYEYIVEAYSRGIHDGGKLADLREASAVIEAYCDGYTRAYGTETPLNPRLAAARMELGSRLATAEERAAATPVVTPKPVEAAPVGPAPAPTPELPPWKPLVITGASLTGMAGVAVAAAVYGGLSGLRLEREFDADCTVDDPSDRCADLRLRGRTANGIVYAGAIFGALLLAAGVPLLVIGVKRKRSAERAVTPLVGRGFVGLGLRAAF